MKSTAFTITLFFLLLFPLAAQEAAPPAVDETALVFEDAGEEAEPDLQGDINTISVWTYVYVILVLAGVVVVIYVVFYFLKRSGISKSPDLDLIKLHSTKVLANNRALHLVEVGNRMLLVGSSENSVNLVSEIDDRETIDAVHLSVSQEQTGRKGFADIFGALFSPGAAAGTRHAEPSTEYIARQRDRLKDL